MVVAVAGSQSVSRLNKKRDVAYFEGCDASLFLLQYGILQVLLHGDYHFLRQLCVLLSVEQVDLH